MRRSVAAVLAAFICLALLPAAPAFAHAEFLGSDPVDGSVFRVAPAVADLHFSESVLLEASTVTLLRLGAGTTERLQISAQDGGSTVRAALPTLPNGAYLLRFVAVDPADLHRTVGTISFGVGVDAPSSAGQSELNGSRWSVVVRALTDALLMLGVGAVMVVWLCHRQGVPIPLRAPKMMVRAAIGAAIGWILLFALSVSSVGFAHARWGKLLVASDPGRRALIGVELAAGMWWAARLLHRGRSSTGAPIATCAGLMLGLVVLASLGGHSGVGGAGLVGSAVRTAHFGSIGLWLGTVAVLWWETRGATDAIELWPAVSRIASYGLALTGATGLLLSARVVSTVTGLFGTLYGRVIVAKAVVLVVLSIVGAFAARSVLRRGAPRRLQAEFVLAAVALALAGVLANSAPAVGARFDPVPVPSPQVVTRDASDLIVSASLLPARPGANLVHLSILETRRPSPGDVQRVTMTLTRLDGTTVATREGVPASGVLEWADVQIVGPGEYSIAVKISRPASAVPDFAGSLSVAPTPVPRVATVLSDRRWAPWALLAAGSWIGVVALGRWLLRRRQGSKRYPLARTVTR